MPKLIALISKKPSISEQDFKIYYETNHAPLIKSLFPSLSGYTRTYLFESNLRVQKLQQPEQHCLSPTINSSNSVILPFFVGNQTPICMAAGSTDTTGRHIRDHL